MVGPNLTSIWHQSRLDLHTKSAPIGMFRSENIAQSDHSSLVHQWVPSLEKVHRAVRHWYLMIHLSLYKHSHHPTDTQTFKCVHSSNSVCFTNCNEVFSLTACHAREDHSIWRGRQVDTFVIWEYWRGGFVSTWMKRVRPLHELSCNRIGMPAQN